MNIVVRAMFFLFASPLIFWIGLNAMQLLDNLKFTTNATSARQKLYFGIILVLAFWSIFFLTI